jgi:hypothetical protein
MGEWEDVLNLHLMWDLLYHEVLLVNVTSKKMQLTEDGVTLQTTRMPGERQNPLSVPDYDN